MRYRAAALAIFFLVSLAFVYTRAGSTARSLGASSQPQRRSQTERRRGTRTVRRATPRIDYANFSHRTAQHQRACDSCHKFPSKNWKEVRKAEAAFPDITEFPEHSSCLECHREQFFARERPAPRICANCHVQITPRNTARFPFPSLTGLISNPARGQEPVSDFAVNFPHDKHVDIVGRTQEAPVRDGSARLVNATFRRESAHRQQESEPKSCAVCHQTYQPQGSSDDEFVTKRSKDHPEDAFWLKRGTFKTAPMTHATCFSCHSEETGVTPAPADCNACHKLPTAAQTPPRADFDPKLARSMGITDQVILGKWRRRDSAGAFRHEVHQDKSCTDCHNIAAMSTLDPKTLRVSVKSCEGCHITPTTDDGGILNYEVEQRKVKPGFQCAKCHVTFGKEPVPPTHLDAISGLNKK